MELKFSEINLHSLVQIVSLFYKLEDFREKSFLQLNEGRRGGELE